jgi:hypothetical protein
MLRQDLNDLPGVLGNGVSPLQRPTILLQYLLGKLLWIGKGKLFLPRWRYHSVPGRGNGIPNNPELCPQIITPKTELPPPSLERREDLWVAIYPRAH